MNTVEYKHIILYALCVLIIGCGRKLEVKGVEKKEKAKPVVVLPEKKVEAKYVYRGHIRRDPFVSLEGKKILSPYLNSQGEGRMPQIGLLALKGIVNDKTGKIALLSTPQGSYILRNNTLYDNRNRIVKGITGKIFERSVKIITNDNFVREIKFGGIE